MTKRKAVFALVVLALAAIGASSSTSTLDQAPPQPVQHTTGWTWDD